MKCMNLTFAVRLIPLSKQKFKIIQKMQKKFYVLGIFNMKKNAKNIEKKRDEKIVFFFASHTNHFATSGIRTDMNGKLK